MKSPSPCRSSLQKIEAESLPRFLFFYSQIALQPMLLIYIGRESPLIYQSDFFRAKAAMTLSMPKSTRYTATR